VQEVISQDNDTAADKEHSALREGTKGRTFQPLLVITYQEKRHNHEWASRWFV